MFARVGKSSRSPADQHVSVSSRIQLHSEFGSLRVRHIMVTVQPLCAHMLFSRSVVVLTRSTAVPCSVAPAVSLEGSLETRKVAQQPIVAIHDWRGHCFRNRLAIQSPSRLMNADSIKTRNFLEMRTGEPLPSCQKGSWADP